MTAPTLADVLTEALGGRNLGVVRPETWPDPCEVSPRPYRRGQGR